MACHHAVLIHIETDKPLHVRCSRCGSRAAVEAPRAAGARVNPSS
jgi:hypothetical protein